MSERSLRFCSRWTPGVTRDLDTHWKLHWVWLNRQGLGIWMSSMTWTKLTVHWIVSDCDLGKVSVTHQVRVV